MTFLNVIEEQEQAEDWRGGLYLNIDQTVWNRLLLLGCLVRVPYVNAIYGGVWSLHILAFAAMWVLSISCLNVGLFPGLWTTCQWLYFLSKTNSSLAESGAMEALP